MVVNSEVRSEDAVLVSDSGGVRTITLNRPEQLNAINLLMIEQLEAAITSAQTDDNIRILRFRGAGRAFCAGDDVNAQSAICEAGEGALRQQLATLQRISELLTLGEKLTVVEVQGWAIGAGFSWALNCDFRFWGEKARAFSPKWVSAPSSLAAQPISSLLYSVRNWLRICFSLVQNLPLPRRRRRASYTASAQRSISKRHQQNSLRNSLRSQ